MNNICLLVSNKFRPLASKSESDAPEFRGLSSRGLGHEPFKFKTRVRIPLTLNLAAFWRSAHSGAPGIIICRAPPYTVH